MLALLAALVLAQDAGLPRAMVLAPSSVTLPDGGTLDVPGGSCWLRADACVEAGQRAAGDDAEKRALRDAVQRWQANDWARILAGAAATAIGTAAGYGLRRP